MNPEQRASARNQPKSARARVFGSARDQLSLLILPTIIGIVVGWRTFASLGDLVLSLILGSVTFVTLTPMLASMSDRDLARRRRRK